MEHSRRLRPPGGVCGHGDGAGPGEGVKEACRGGEGRKIGAL